jgi:hypothetical protein
MLIMQKEIKNMYVDSIHVFTQFVTFYDMDPMWSTEVHAT